MDDEAFNMSMRKFLKTVGVTSQQQIEEAMRTARDDGSLGAAPIAASMRLSIPALGLDHFVEGTIAPPDAE